MDTMRGSFGSLAESGGYDPAEDEAGPETPPAAIGQDERRMQVRAYNHWASLLDNKNFPSIEDLEPENLPDFGPYSVLLDFSSGIEDPGISYLGSKLAEECGVGEEELRTLAEVPSRSLLTRITDHYMQILANQAPIGFEAEFVNQRGATIAYRGILLPFSSDDDTIDFIYGVINWKELADAQASDELLLEIDQVLEPRPATPAHREDEAPLTDWADGPAASAAAEAASGFAADGAYADRGLAEQPEAGLSGLAADDDLPVPSFGLRDEDEPDELLAEAVEDEEDEEAPGPRFGSLLKMPIQFAEPAEPSAYEEADLDALGGPTKIELPELDPADMELGDWLAAAREMAAAARTSEDRTRNALYDAIGRAYDFALAAAEAPEEFAELIADSGLTRQDRAPMTPVVKLVFGADYDKTRLTEYAAALTHAHRLQLPLGTLGDFLSQYEGGLKGVVKAERRLRKEEAGKAIEPADAPRHALAKKLRAMPARDFGAIASEGNEFALVMIRRTDADGVVVLGEVPDDVALVERAARKLIG